MKTIHVTQLDDLERFSITVKGNRLRGDSDRLLAAYTFAALIEVLREEFPNRNDKNPEEG